MTEETNDKSYDYPLCGSHGDHEFPEMSKYIHNKIWREMWKM